MFRTPDSRHTSSFIPEAIERVVRNRGDITPSTLGVRPWPGEEELEYGDDEPSPISAEYRPPQAKKPPPSSTPGEAASWLAWRPLTTCETRSHSPKPLPHTRHEVTDDGHADFADLPVEILPAKKLSPREWKQLRTFQELWVKRLEGIGFVASILTAAIITFVMQTIQAVETRADETVNSLGFLSLCLSIYCTAFAYQGRDWILTDRLDKLVEFERLAWPVIESLPILLHLAAGCWILAVLILLGARFSLGMLLPSLVATALGAVIYGYLTLRPFLRPEGSATRELWQQGRIRFEDDFGTPLYELVFQAAFRWLPSVLYPRIAATLRTPEVYPALAR